jgi:predicted dienelactone hydrolase
MNGGLMRVHCLAVTLFASAAICSAQAPPPAFYSVPPVDAPELAPEGKYSVGVRTLEIKNPGQPDILNFDKTSGKAPLYDRPLTIEIWYPAVIPDGKQEHTIYQMSLPGRGAAGSAAPKVVSIEGKALRDAAPVKGQFPLVIVSHGYPGSRYFLSYLTENLASKGYVVAAIDHTDSVLGAERGFPSTLLNRSSDQLFTIGAVEGMSAKASNFLQGIVDDSAVAIVGYSMGGYGALASAGAGYSKKNLATAIVPGGYFDEHMAGSTKYQSSLRKEVKAIVAISPWGNQPPQNFWDAEGLAGIHIPMLMIAGDQDDISDFKNGIKPAFDQAVNSDRCLLVYENARHNVGGNPPSPEVLTNFTTREYYDEPVWRKDRIMAINQHFITAFLDYTLKGDQSKRDYLRLATEKSNDGTWPLAQGESAGAKFNDGATYWKGFQRRWAVGLEMICAAASQAAK